MATTRVFYKGKKELTMAQFEALTSLDDAVDYNITDFPNGGITNEQMTAALGYSRLFVDGDVFVCSDSGTYTKGHTYQVKVTNGVKSWEDITPASGDLQNYQIVTDEPTDKSEGKMIYQKSAATTFGKAVINKTAGEGSYSSPSDVFEKLGEGTATASDLENYEYMLQASTDGYVTGYINLGYLPALTQYITSHNSFNLLYKVNGGEEQTDTLTLDTETGYYTGTNLIVLRTSELDNTTGVPNDYYTASIQNSQAFAVATTDTIEITRLNIGGTYVIVEKESSSSFDITNLKIANGSQYNSLKDYLGGSPLYKHELVIPYSFSVGDSETVNGSAIYHYLSNTGTQITSASEIDDNFLLSGGIGKNSTNTVLLFDVNVTKAGSSITVEAVIAATMGYVTGTVGTITDTVTQLI